MPLRGIIQEGILPQNVVAAATSAIVSIQLVEITISASSSSNTATITSVNTSNTALVWCGFVPTSTISLSNRDAHCYFTLTNSTTVTLTRSTATMVGTVKAACYVVEFNSSYITSIQRGTITIAAGSTSNTATITSVNTSHSAVFYLGNDYDNSLNNAGHSYCKVALTNSTTVTASSQGSTGNKVVSYCVVNFNSSKLAQNTQQLSIAMSGTNNQSNAFTAASNDSFVAYGGQTWNFTTTRKTKYYRDSTSNMQSTSNASATPTSDGVLTVVDFVDGTLAQQDRNQLVSIASGTTNTITLGSGTQSKMIAYYLGCTQSGTSAQPGHHEYIVKCTSATVVQVERITGYSATLDMSVERVEFA